MWGDCNLQLLHQVQEERMITLLHSLCWKLGVSSSRNSGFQEQIGCQIQEKIAWLSSRFEFCQFTGKDCAMIKTLWGGAWLWKRKGLVTCQMFPCIEAGWLQMTMVGISCWGTSCGPGMCGAWRNMNIPHVLGFDCEDTKQLKHAAQPTHVSCTHVHSFLSSDSHNIIRTFISSPALVETLSNVNQG